jgi:hypothetical protein
MSSKEKIKKLESLINQAFQDNWKCYILSINKDTKKYEYKNELNEIEYYKSSKDFQKKKNIPDNSNDVIICIEYV